MNISYRNYTDSDVNSIIQFWNENSGWETNLDIAEFKTRFCSCPMGEPIIMLAIDDSTNEIVGICCFLPGLVQVNNSTALCFRPFGAIIKETVRKKFGITSFFTGNHPMIRLCLTGIEVARQKQAALIYLIPDPRWIKILKVLNIGTCKFPLMSYPLSNGNTLDSKTQVRELLPTDPQIDILSGMSSMLGNCTLYKDTRFYEWKVNFRHGLYKLKGVYDDDRLIGIFTTHFKPDDRQWLLNDLLTLDNDKYLVKTLAAACNSIQIEYKENFETDGKSYKIAILATPLLEQKLTTLNFHRDSYDFHLAVQLLDKQNFSKSDVSPKHWHLSAND